MDSHLQAATERLMAGLFENAGKTDVFLRYSEYNGFSQLAKDMMILDHDSGAKA